MPRNPVEWDSDRAEVQIGEGIAARIQRFLNLLGLSRYDRLAGSLQPGFAHLIRYVFSGALEHVLTGNQVSHCDIEYPRYSQGKEIADRYPIGKVVRVYYDSDNPEMAVLDDGTNRGATMQLGLGSLFFCLGAALAIVGRF